MFNQCLHVVKQTSAFHDCLKLLENGHICFQNEIRVSWHLVRCFCVSIKSVFVLLFLSPFHCYVFLLTASVRGAALCALY